jgi:threonine/homoserine/homoserine lactone efflux protein
MALDFAALVPIVLILCMGAISPGPSLAVLLRNTIEGGRGRGVACAIGHGIGFGIYAFVAISGISELKAAGGGQVTTALEVAGAGFLLWLAYLMLRAREGNILEDANEQTDDLSSNARLAERQGFVEGFLIAFLNPKILAFQMAVFSQFLQPDFTWMERGIVATIAMCIDGGWYLLVALVITGTPLLVALQDNRDIVEKAMGALLAVLALWILWSAVL